MDVTEHVAYNDIAYFVFSEISRFIPKILCILNQRKAFCKEISTREKNKMIEKKKIY